MQKDVQAEVIPTFWLQYEKRKMKECADTLHNLASAFLIEEKDEEEKDRQNLFYKKRIKENRILMADHLKEMASIIQNIAEEKTKIICLSTKQEKMLAKMLSVEGLVLEEFSILEKGNGRKEVLARIYQNSFPGKKKYYTSEEVAEFLSVFLNMQLVASINTPFFVGNQPENFCFEEDVSYMVLTGYAKTTKEGEKVSGDNFVFFESGDKKFYSILSDGMGSGEKACKDSEEVIDMAERFLEGGLSDVTTVKMMNDFLLAKGDGKNMSTLDLCSIDLYTGQAGFLKVGATYGLLKRDGYVEKIPSISLPLGVFHDMEMNQYEKTLLDGDYIFLFSDGILDYFYGEQGEVILKEIVAQIPYKRPSEMASHILKLALSTSQGKIKDDTTILVMGIWENGKMR
ncbi:MAG: SpoIIE family protein phosphatase [Lachnospiraceae bacterium]|nr:SpoIIE family protein phosphatase [Lachnospiraceae bacterium]